MTYRAAPITQRDNSPLASSNCRMASVACGLDYETLGAKTSTGAKMRSYTDDQSGGTDSGDAKQSWSRGYGEALRVMDGRTWADAVADLKAGRLVHIDVWHAAVGGVCVSGSGAYGHTMAIAPEANGSRWLVSDPWCNPPKWQWVEAANLQRGAEEWGRRAAVKADIHTGGRHWTKAEIVLVVLAAKAYMGRYHPDFPDLDPDEVPDTGGVQPILYTTTKAQDGAGGTDMRFVNVNGNGVTSTKLLNVGAGSKWLYLDGSAGGSFSKAAALPWLGSGDSETGEHVVALGTGGPYTDGKTRDTLVLVRSSNQPYDAQPAPVPPDTDGSYDEGWNDANAAAKAAIDGIIPPR